MMNPAYRAISEILEALIVRYRARVPDLAAIENSMLADGIIASRDQLVNDHVAFRTIGVPQLGIASLEPLFLHHGYIRRDAYRFAAKHLDARWYHPPADVLPRIFISELSVDELPLESARIIRSYTDSLLSAPLSEAALDDPTSVVRKLEAPLWPRLHLADYRTLLEQSEYGAWVLLNAYGLNHLTLSVHELRADLRSVAALNVYLERRGYTLNDAGGTIKTSPDGLLVQSSTVAQTIEAAFSGGETGRVAGSYIEFAERRVLPAFAHLPDSSLRREHRRDGFEAANADRIFESTDSALIRHD